jgi:hypothetical protein
MASVTSSEAGGAIQAVRESAWRWTEFAAAQTGPSASTWSDTEASRRVQIAQDAALLQFAELRVNAVRRHAAKLYDSWRLSDDPADHDDHNAIDEYQAAVDEALLSAIESGPFTS